MKIVAFGDSFQQGVEKLIDYSLDCYEGLLLNHYKADVEFHGEPGSGPWNAFFKCKTYLEETEVMPDVVLFGWSEASRLLYHPDHPCLNAPTAKQKMQEDILDADLYKTAFYYGKYLATHKKENHELRALMMYFDRFVLKYPKIKFINIHNFSLLQQYEFWDKFDKIGPKQLQYHYKFKNSAEVRPALMWMSRRHGWPGDKNMHLETRTCHLTIAMHILLAEVIIQCIDNYSPGLVVEIEPYKMDKPYLEKMVPK